MSSGVKAKIGKLMVLFLLICGSVIIAINASAQNESAVLTFNVDPAVVVVDGTEDVNVDVELVSKSNTRLSSISGYFTTTSYENPVQLSLDTLRCNLYTDQAQEEHDLNMGYFSLAYNLDYEYNWVDAYQSIYTMTYTVPKEASVGVYHVPIMVSELTTLDAEGNIAIQEVDLEFDAQIIVKRPNQIVFWDEYAESVTEINKYYGDSDFTVIPGVYEGDGIITSYDVHEEGSDGVVSVISGTYSLHIEGVGSVEVCASSSETEFYAASTSCYTVNVEKRALLISYASAYNKYYDGTTNAELEFVYFGQDVNITDEDYEVVSAVLDNPNVGNREATFEIALTELGESRYTLIETSVRTAVVVSPADLQEMSAVFTPQDYDRSLQYQTLPVVVSGLLNGERVTLVEGVDFELLYGGSNLYTDIWLTEADTYDITISSLSGSNYVFEHFDAPFTINPLEVTVLSAQVNDKVYDKNNEAEVSSITFSDDDLVPSMDFAATATLEGTDAGTWDAVVDVTLYNSNYYFYDHENEVSSSNTTYTVHGVEITPRELTDQNTTYDFHDRVFYYSGERIEPIIPLSISFPDSFEPDELTIEQDYTIVYSSDTVNGGAKTATLVGTGNFSGSIGPLEYYILGSRANDVEVTTPAKVYTGEALEPEPIVTGEFNGNRVTFMPRDYVFEEHDDFVNAGSYDYRIMESNDSNYHFSTADATFTILPYEITSSNISLSESTYKYNGTSQIPTVTVTVGNTTISSGSYDLDYSPDTVGNDENDTTVTVTVTAKDNTNITGSATATYAITPRDVLTISGVEDNQQIGYTGSPVILSGNVMVEDNPGGITVEDLTVQWYANDGNTIIDRPTDAGLYKVVYSYSDADYRGSLVVNFEITKASSPSPAEMDADFRIVSGQTLAELEGTRTIGFAWVDDGTVVAQGNNTYAATYTHNNDTTNYETVSLNVPVYGLAQVHVNATGSTGGEVSVSSQDVLEGDTITITISVDRGHILESITVNGADYTDDVDANTLSIVAGYNDIEIVATFAELSYDVIEGAEQTIVLGEEVVAVFRIDADYGLFTNGGAVYVDDALVGNGCYNSWDGSTYIQLTDDYLNTLSIGTHTLRVAFNDGGVATTTFTIAKANDGGDSEGGDSGDKDDGGDSEGGDSDSGDSDNTGSNEDGDEEEAVHHMVVPNTGFFTMIGGGAATTVSLLAVVLAACVAVRRARR